MNQLEWIQYLTSYFKGRVREAQRARPCDLARVRHLKAVVAGCKRDESMEMTRQQALALRGRG